MTIAKNIDYILLTNREFKTVNVIIIQRPFSEIPGKPGTPKITDWDVDNVELTWSEPKHDGGAPITGYVIEKKEKLSTAWDEILTTKVRTGIASVETIRVCLTNECFAACSRLLVKRL